MTLPPDLAKAIATARAALSHKSIRQQYGETMLALAAERDFTVLTADLMHATGMAAFGERYPDRMLNLGIAEQNMAGVAAGLALSGRSVVVCGYAAFTVLRGLEQVKLDAAYNDARVIFTAQSAGLSYGVGGPTHQSCEDVAIMRSIPNMAVLVPSDAVEVDACLRVALAWDGAGPVYVRLGRGPEWTFNPAGTQFEIGRATHLREGADLCFIANGAMVVEALLAADVLAMQGVGCTVLNVATVKPLDEPAIRDAVRGKRATLVIEEHSVIGGLGSAVLEALAEVPHGPVRRIGIPDLFPPIGPTHDLRTSLGLCADNIVLQALELLR